MRYNSKTGLPRKGMVDLVSYIPKDGRPFKKDVYNPRSKFKHSLSHDSVLYELREKVTKMSGTNFFSYIMEEEPDSWEVIVCVKRDTKLYRTFLELGFGEI